MKKLILVLLIINGCVLEDLGEIKSIKYEIRSESENCFIEIWQFYKEKKSDYLESYKKYENYNFKDNNLSIYMEYKENIYVIIYIYNNDVSNDFIFNIYEDGDLNIFKKYIEKNDYYSYQYFKKD